MLVATVTLTVAAGIVTDEEGDTTVIPDGALPDADAVLVIDPAVMSAGVVV